MARILPFFLVLLVVAGAWRRDADVLKPEPRAPAVRTPAAVPTIEEREVAAPVVPVRSSPTVRTDAEERERQLVQKVAALETALQEAWEKIDAHRAQLAKLVSGNMEGRLLVALEYSRKYADRLEQDLQLMEAAYVELAAKHRRSD